MLKVTANSQLHNLIKKTPTKMHLLLLYLKWQVLWHPNNQFMDFDEDEKKKWMVHFSGSSSCISYNHILIH